MKAQLYRPIHQGRSMKLQTIQLPRSRQSRIKCIRSLATEVARAHGYTLADILKRDRHGPLVRARQSAMRLALASGFAVGEVAQALGRSHPTVCHAARKSS